MFFSNSSKFTLNLSSFYSSLRDASDHSSFTFLSGALCGALFATCVIKTNIACFRQIKDSHTMTFEEAEQKLESDGKINVHLSLADNAINILLPFLNDEISQPMRASLLYAIHALKSSLSQCTVPVGLNLDSIDSENLDDFESENFGCELRRERSRKRSSLREPEVRDWLVINYTPHTRSMRSTRYNSFNRTPVQFAIKFSLRSSSLTSPDNYVLDVSPDEMNNIRHALRRIDDWDWNIWDLEDASKGRPIQTLGWHLFYEWGLVEKFKLDPDIVRNWLAFVENMYEDNEYHNSLHAADVLQAVHFLLGRGGAAEYLHPLAILAILVSAMIHDAGHDGHNNLFHQNALTDRALTFNDQSIQENFHCMSIFTSMAQDSSINILGGLSAESAREVRRLVILMVLATDMKSHFQTLQEFKGLVERLGRARERWAADAAAGDWLCANLIHAADLSNPCRPFPLAEQWAGAVLEEHFLQGDLEARLGLPVSPLCSRSSTLMPASQVGFISFVVLPYFQVLGELLPAVGEGLVPQAEANLRAWAALDASAAAFAAANAAAPDPPTPRPPSPPAPEPVTLAAPLTGPPSRGSLGSCCGEGGAALAAAAAAAGSAAAAADSFSPGRFSARRRRSSALRWSANCSPEAVARSPGLSAGNWPAPPTLTAPPTGRPGSQSSVDVSPVTARRVGPASGVVVVPTAGCGSAGPSEA